MPSETDMSYCCDFLLVAFVAYCLSLDVVGVIAVIAVCCLLLIAWCLLLVVVGAIAVVVACCLLLLANIIMLPLLMLLLLP